MPILTRRDAMLIMLLLLIAVSVRWHWLGGASAQILHRPHPNLRELLYDPGNTI